MALLPYLYDRVKESCSAPGTGSVTLLGAATGFQSFSGAGVANGDKVPVCIADQSGANWEVGYHTWTTGGVLTRAAANVLAGSAGAGTLTNFSAGTQDVFLTSPAAWMNRDGPTYPVPASGWSWLNQGSGVATLAYGQLNLFCPQNSGGGANGLRGHERTAPATPWTADFLFRFAYSFLDDAAAGNSIAGIGVYVRNSSNGKIVSYTIECGSSPLTKLTSYAWDSATSINTTYVNRTNPVAPWAPVWMRIYDDGTNIGLKLSPDGRDWTLNPDSRGRTAFITSGPDKYGFCINPYSMKTSATLLSLKEG